MTQEHITVVCWKWGGKYTSAHVNALSRNLVRYLKLPHHLICLTDDASGLDSSIQTLPLPYESGKVNLRRLWLFSEEASLALGSRILQLDLDIVITSDITPLMDTLVPFKIWRSTGMCRMGWSLNPTVLLMNSGWYTEIWDQYTRNPLTLIRDANRAGCCGSDQAIITYLLSSTHQTTKNGQPFTNRTTNVQVWDESDGIIGYRPHIKFSKDPTQLPDSTRIVSFHGSHDPVKYAHLDWVHEYWNTPLEVSQ